MPYLTETEDSSRHVALIVNGGLKTSKHQRQELDSCGGWWLREDLDACIQKKGQMKKRFTLA